MKIIFLTNVILFISILPVINQAQRKQLMTYCAGWGLGGSWLFSWSLLRTLVVTPIRYLRTENEPKIFEVYIKVNIKVCMKNLFYQMIFSYSYLLSTYLQRWERSECKAPLDNHINKPTQWLSCILGSRW